MTIFSRIVSGEIPADKLYEDEHVLAFRDISPKAPVHVLVIPKRPIVSVAHADDDDCMLMGRLMLAAAQVAREQGLDETGYRVVTNVGEDGGQSVFHLHLHVLGGRRLSWPPG